MKNSMKTRKLGFTLAEILIALAVIGIAAAMTIPVLLQNVGDQQFKSAWKNSYALFNQAYSLISMDNAGNLTSVFTNATTMQTLFLGKLGYTKACAVNTVPGNCWMAQASWTDQNADPGTTALPVLASATLTTGAVLANGSYVAFVYDAAACTANNGLGALDCGRIAVDVNGAGSPNKAGKDIFMIHVQNNKLAPFGSTNSTGVSDDFACGNSGTAPTGIGCSSDYLSAS